MKPILEPATQAFISELESKGGTPIYKLSPKEARAILEKVQSGPVKKAAVSIEEKALPCGPSGKVAISIVRPENSKEKLPVILFVHGAGWILGSFNTHDHLVRELAVGTNSAVVFVHYSLSPEARFPIAIEESYAVAEYLTKNGASLNLDASRLAVCGDSVGGNMSIALTMMANERKGPKFDCQVLFYPVTSAEMNTPSYNQFANGPWLTKPAMEWFWNAYESDASARKNHLCSPLLAPIDQLKGLPQAIIITAENDVLRDEGEQYASRLMQAGVNVTATRFLGTTHDFVMLNALSETPAARGAIYVAANYLNQVWASKKISKPSKKAA
ncbi:MAG: alpha/beta hydrolase [Verrucomicrobia bacterium]|nr:alpha/beta hydrolase [Verrucomicrobiota bacterium]